MHDACAADIDLADPAVGKDFAVGTANLDLHAGDRPPAVNDGAIAARALGIGGAAGKLSLLDELEPDAFSGWHQRYGERGFGKTIAGAKSARIEPCGVEAVDKGLHDLGPDHVGAVAGDPPARQIEPVLGSCLRTHPA